MVIVGKRIWNDMFAANWMRDKSSVSIICFHLYAGYVPHIARCRPV
jgi:hypothetical protein